MKCYKFNLRQLPGLEICEGQLWRKGWSTESLVDLDEAQARLEKVFGKDSIYRYVNMLGITGVEIYN